MKDETIQLFLGLYGTSPDIVVKSPGRINLIGEHTDYNLGFVLPAAINKAVYIAIGKREDRELHIFSEEFNNSSVASLDNLKPSHGWTSYILGVIDQFLKKGILVDGLNIVLNSELPIGSGLASSAAIECAVAYALNKMYNLNITSLQLALMSQKAEHEYAKVNCGIMDQFASLFGKQGHVIKLDCKSMDFTYYPLSLVDYKIVLLDSQIRHTHAYSEYNKRSKECEQGVRFIHRTYKSIRSLRDTNILQIEECLKTHVILYRRCKFIVEENERLHKACDYLVNEDFISLGRVMNETHEGLSKLYEVSCNELDFLAAKAQLYPGVLGARMMGGGFGGCTINLVKADAVDGLIQHCTEAFKSEMDMELKAYVVDTAGGTEVLVL